MGQVDNREYAVRERRALDAEPASEGDLSGYVRHVGQLVAMRGFFAAPFELVSDDLYSKVKRGAVSRDRGTAVVHRNSVLSTDTYFGCFPASYWQRWTNVSTVDVGAVVCGSGTFSVFASDYNASPRVVRSTRVEDADERQVRFEIPIDKFVDGGMLWLEAETDEGTLEIRDVRWMVNGPARSRSTAVVLCTHNRPDDCLFTLRTLAENVESLLAIDTVYVVDQGDDTVQSRAEFDRIRQLFGAKLRYRRQTNLGGAGGFTRGLYEVADGRQGDHANVLFMDDDILLEPDIIVRMTAFANSTVEPTIVGAQMLRLLHPKLSHVSAEVAEFTPLHPGKVAPGAVQNADMTEVQQALRVDADYNAWWCCLLPPEIVASIGYPLPMFLQWDDVEYGYRARAHGHSTVTLPGAAVWHADFDWKDEDEWVRYFTLRNGLIINALHGDFQPRVSAAVALGWIFRCLVSMRYGQAATLVKAIEDFLVGPEVLDDGGARALADVRTLRRQYPETIRHPASDVADIPATGRPIVKAAPAPSHQKLVLAKRLAWHLLGRTRDRVSVPWVDSQWWHVSRYETAIVTDASQEAVRVRKADRAKLVRLGAAALRIAWDLNRGGKRVQQRWQQAAPQLASRDNWTRLYSASADVNEDAAFDNVRENKEFPR